MLFSWFADLVVVFHLTFVVFVACGGFLALQRPRAAWLHLPAFAWGVAIECAGWICPLTPLENRLRMEAGEAGYSGGFIEHYLLPILYPAGLTRPAQWVLAAILVACNVVVYALVLRRLWRRRKGIRRPS